MKPQDVVFLVIFFGLLYIRRPQLLVWAALVCLTFSIPLFATWTFFTAERLTWYAVAFILTFLLLPFPATTLRK